MTIRIIARQVDGDVSPLLHRRLADEELGGRLASGEAAAFDELYRRYAHRLAAYGAHLLGDAAAGDDVAHSALLKAYSALRTGRVPQRMRPWLYRIAHNAALDLVARRRDLPAAELPERVVHEHPPRAGALLEAMAALPERQRHVYVLREVHGLRIDETCAQLGLTTVQVEQALFAARNRLAEHLTFGERLNCVAVQRLASGPLDGDERRALKTHLRGCASCRSSLGLRGRALSFLPPAALDWLRGLASAAVGGGAPVAAKVGAVVATATVAVGIPSAVHDASPQAHAVAPSKQLVRRPAERRPIAPAEHVVALLQRTPATASAATRTRRHVEREHETAQRRASEPTRSEPVGAGRDDSGGSEGPSAQPADAPTVSTPALTTVTTTVEQPTSDGGGRGGETGSDDGGSSGGDGTD